MSHLTNVMSQGVDLVTSLQGQVIATALVKKKPASRLSVYCQSVHVASILSTHVMVCRSDGLCALYFYRLG